MKQSKKAPARSIESYLKPIPTDKPLGAHYKISIAAHMMSMSTRWVRKKIEEGFLDAYKFGTTTVVSLESINAYFEMCRITGQAKSAAENPAEDEGEED